MGRIVRATKEDFVNLHKIYKEYKSGYISLDRFVKKSGANKSKLVNFIAKKDLYASSENRYIKFMKIFEYIVENFPPETRNYRQIIANNGYTDVTPTQLSIFSQHLNLTKRLINCGIPFEEVFSEHKFLLEDQGNKNGMKFNKVKVENPRDNIIMTPDDIKYAFLDEQKQTNEIEMVIQGIKILIPGHITAERVVRIINFIRDL